MAAKKNNTVSVLETLKNLQDKLSTLSVTEMESMFADETAQAIREETSSQERIVKDGIFIMSFVRFYKWKEGWKKANEQAKAKGRKREIDSRYAFLACSYADLFLRGLNPSDMGGEKNWRVLLNRIYECDKTGKDGVFLNESYVQTVQDLSDGKHVFTSKEGKETTTTMGALASDAILETVFPPNKVELKKKKNANKRAKKLGWTIKKFDGMNTKKIVEMVKKWWKESNLDDEENEDIATAIRSAFHSLIVPVAIPTPLPVPEQELAAK